LLHLGEGSAFQLTVFNSLLVQGRQPLPSGTVNPSFPTALYARKLPIAPPLVREGPHLGEASPVARWAGLIPHADDGLLARRGFSLPVNFSSLRSAGQTCLAVFSSRKDPFWVFFFSLRREWLNPFPPPPIS